MLRSLSKLQLFTLSFAFLGIVAFAVVPATVYAEPPTGTESQEADICADSNDPCNHFIDTYINPIIYLLSGLVGVVAVISIIFAGIQYASSADDPGAVTKAKQRVFQTVIGLVAYIFLFAFLEYLIPGGIIG